MSRPQSEREASATTDIDEIIAPNEYYTLLSKTAVIDKERWDNEIEDPNKEGVHPKDLNTWVLRWMVEQHEVVGGALFRHFKEDFSAWTVDTFKKLDKNLRTKFLDLLQHNGLWLQRVRGGPSNSEILEELLQLDHPNEWTKERTEEARKSDFVFHKTFDTYLQNKFSSRASTPRVMISTPRRQAAQRPKSYSPTRSKLIASLLSS